MVCSAIDGTASTVATERAATRNRSPRPAHSGTGSAVDRNTRQVRVTHRHRVRDEDVVGHTVDDVEEPRCRPTGVGRIVDERDVGLVAVGGRAGDDTDDGLPRNGIGEVGPHEQRRKCTDIPLDGVPGATRLAVTVLLAQTAFGVAAHLRCRRNVREIRRRPAK